MNTVYSVDDTFRILKPRYYDKSIDQSEIIQKGKVDALSKAFVCSLVPRT